MLALEHSTSCPSSCRVLCTRYFRYIGRNPRGLRVSPTRVHGSAMWGIDIGTTNSTLGHWDKESDRPQLVALPGLERPAVHADPGAPPQRIVPSATQLIESPGAWARFTSSGPLARHVLSGRLAHIG